MANDVQSNVHFAQMGSDCFHSKIDLDGFFLRRKFPKMWMYLIPKNIDVSIISAR